MKDRRERSVVDNAMLIESIIAGELRSWIPEKGVEDFNFRWSQLWDIEWWYFRGDDRNYLYLDREWWYHVTVQKCYFNQQSVEWPYYWNVYIEKEVTDKSLNIPEELVRHNQWVCHTFRWVRSLKHALYLWEVASENIMGFAYPEEYFLTRDEYDEAFKWFHK